VLGDLAQATSPGAQTNWNDAAADLEADGARVEHLTVGYRVPEPIMSYANRILPEIAVGLTPPLSVRQTGLPPEITSTEPHRLIPTVVAEVADIGGKWPLVAVVVPDRIREAVGQALTQSGLGFVDGTVASALGDHVTLLLATAAKGLEFDAVVVVEPGQIAAEAGGDLRVLYVALTRAVQHLSIVHADPLPTALAPR
jgi:DNA helicase IV